MYAAIPQVAFISVIILMNYRPIKHRPSGAQTCLFIGEVRGGGGSCIRSRWFQWVKAWIIILQKPINIVAFIYFVQYHIHHSLLTGEFGIKRSNSKT
ncbi:MAG: hypothetical protein CL925_00170 [Deltaproteobacteria bacterium]|nr:hypothetical protein [Deltaproteobacteria bacterium]